MIVQKLLVFIFLFTNTILSYGQNRATGHFVSNFPESGWFMTQIQLNEDLTFKYQFVGDLFFDKAEGTYEVDEDTIKLTFNKELLYDTLHVPQDSTSIIVIQNLYADKRPTKWLYKRNKLWRIDDNKQLKKKSYDRKGRAKNFYLKRVDYNWKDW